MPVESQQASRAAANAKRAGEAQRSLSGILKAFDDYSKRMQSEFDVSGPQLWVLWELQQCGPLSMSEIARRMYLHPSTVGGIADRLEDKALAQRVRQSRDRRVVYLEITSTGAELLSRAPVPMRHRLLRALEEMPPTQLEALAKGLSLLARTCAVNENRAASSE